MKILGKILSILGGVAVLYGLYATHVIEGQSAIMIALIAIIFVFIIGDLETTLNKNIGKVDKTVGNISMYIITKDNLQAGYFATGSPIILTPLAEKVLQESGAQKIITDSLPTLIPKIEAKKPKDDLDVRVKAFSVAEELISSEQFVAVKNFVYQHPKYPDQHGKDFNILILTSLISIYLSAEYLKTHSDLDEGKKSFDATRTP